MSNPIQTLAYSSAMHKKRRGSVPFSCLILAIALVPLFTMFFMPTARQYSYATTITIVGFLASPINLAWSAFLALRYRRSGFPFGIALSAAILAGAETTFLAYAIIYIARHGIPC